MQFVPNGPDIPNELLQAHEEGRVVFFCGAGISYPAGLPSFHGLVKRIYKETNTRLNKIETAPWKRKQYDATLDLLERRLPGQRREMRRALANSLTPDLTRNDATDSHLALLQLAHDRNNTLRLVTTNFDRLFHIAAARSKQSFETYSSPLLPIPKKSRWNGLVYLHGLMPEDYENEFALNRLVVTSGDFGLAYLTERWAARFVSELFQNFVVCFVGYSINDPVLRYMMDALAADRLQGEFTPIAWALGAKESGKESPASVEWQAKGVRPILYSSPDGKNDHSLLHLTLKSWAEVYRDGITGKESIVTAHASARPSASTQQDDFVGRMLWALSDPSGLPARRFAEFEPAPSLDWLFDAFTVHRDEHTDLERSGASPCNGNDENLKLSRSNRLKPNSLTQQIRLLTNDDCERTQWSNVAQHLANWLLLHIGDPALLLWFAESGARLNKHWAFLIENRLDELSRLEFGRNISELNLLRTRAPNAIPNPPMQKLWRLMLSGRVKSSSDDPLFYRWKERLKRDGLTYTNRLKLRKFLSPQVSLSSLSQLLQKTRSDDEATSADQLVDWELTLAQDNVHSIVKELMQPNRKADLVTLLDELQLLLRDALDLARELRRNGELSDHSHWALPSISPHWQNRGYRDWALLIEMLRDAWIVMQETDNTRAAQIAASWFSLPYPAFKRLALFCASQNNCINPTQWVDWIGTDQARWLWATETQREICRLLVQSTPFLTHEAQDRLESTILAGPPSAMQAIDLDPHEYKELLDHFVWLRLAKLNSSGVTLGTECSERLKKISLAHPTWELASNEEDEFPNWMIGTGDPGWEKRQKTEITPSKHDDLVRWLSKPKPEWDPFQKDTWRDFCRKHLLKSLNALCDLAQKNLWPVERWRSALQTWSEGKISKRAWRFGAPLVQKIPDKELLEIVHAVAWWLQAASGSLDRHESILIDISQRILRLPLDPDPEIRNEEGNLIGQPVMEAINHPIGLVTRSLIQLWVKRGLSDGDKLPPDIRSCFTELTNVDVARLQHGRAILASQVITLFRVDPEWTKHHLLHLFDWKNNSNEACAAWTGFLWSPRIHRPLLEVIKPQLLSTVHHYEDLSREHRRQFATLLTYAALEGVKGYTLHDWRTAFLELPGNGLKHASQALTQALRGTADQREKYWKSRILPFFQKIWPKSRSLATSGIAESLARLCIDAGDEFPVALSTFQDWLRTIEMPHDVVQRLHESEMCRRFPNDALRFLATIITNEQWIGSELKYCLDAIVQERNNLARDPDFLRLQGLSRMHSD